MESVAENFPFSSENLRNKSLPTRSFDQHLSFFGLHSNRKPYFRIKTRCCVSRQLTSAGVPGIRLGMSAQDVCADICLTGPTSVPTKRRRLVRFVWKGGSPIFSCYPGSSVSDGIRRHSGRTRSLDPTGGLRRRKPTKRPPLVLAIMRKFLVVNFPQYIRLRAFFPEKLSNATAKRRPFAADVRLSTRVYPAGFSSFQCLNYFRQNGFYSETRLV